MAASLTGLAVMACLLVLVARQTFPYLPRELDLRISLPPSIEGTTEPIISTGFYGNADFLTVRYLSATQAVLIYDSWGKGGPTSPPFAIDAGKIRMLRVEMPSLTAARKTAPQGLLRVTLDGHMLFDIQANYHPRRAQELVFGTNPIGGETAGARFRGTIETHTGRVLRGGPESYFTWTERIRSLFGENLPRVGIVAALAAIVGIAVYFRVPTHMVRMAKRLKNSAPVASRRQAPHLAFAITISVCALAFTHLMTFGRFDVVHEESFGTFYDHQAASLLAGRLDVPEAALGGEAFYSHGKVYGYFGPTPAVLRIPLVVTGFGFGKVSRLFMVLHYLAALAGAYALLCGAVRLVCGTGAWPSVWATIVFVGTVGLGSTFFFLGSRAYIYHEAILCGAAFALWAGYATLRYLEEGLTRQWITALLLGIAAIHARPPLGLFALTFVAMAACVRAWESIRTRGFAAAVRPLVICACAGAGVLSFNLLSYAKFRTFEGCPLRLNVQYNAERLARIDGKQFHLANVPFSAATYLYSPTLNIDSRFPYFHSGEVTDLFPDAKLDLTEPTVGIPWCMPALCSLALLAWMAGNTLPRKAAIAAWAAVIPMTLALFAAIAVSQRYTGDFMPFLVIAGALGMSTLDTASQRIYRSARYVAVLLAIFSMAATTALALHFRAYIWGSPDHARKDYEALQRSVDALFHKR